LIAAGETVYPPFASRQLFVAEHKVPNSSLGAALCDDAHKKGRLATAFALRLLLVRAE
jgi:hypothetical protein